MSATLEQANNDPLTLAEFEARRGPVGLFTSYCRARGRHWPLRQLLPLALILIFLQGGDSVVTAWTAVLVLLADTLDIAVLRRFAKRPPKPEDLPVAQGLATFTAALHGLCVSIATASLLSLGADLRFIAATISVGMVLDSSLQFALNPTACFARTLPNALLLFGIYFVAWGNVSDGVAIDLVSDTVAAGLMLLFGLSFIGTVSHQRARSQSMQRATLQQAEALADMNRTLKDARRKTRRLAHVVEQTQDAIIISDTKGAITWTNAAYEEMMGPPPGSEKTSEPSIMDVLGNGPEERALLCEAIERRHALRIDSELKRRDGSQIWLDVSLSPMREEDRPGESFVAVIRDISEHKRREAALAEARAEAEAAALAKTTFLATMSHEIRTPMNGVIATSDLLLDTSLDGEQRSLVETISSSGEALLTIINDILDLTKLDAGKLETSQQPFLPGKLLGSVVGLVTPLAEAKALQIRMTVAESLPDVLVGDEARIRQILLNLLGNAIKFTEQGAIRVDLDARRADGRCKVRFSVIDTGVGIAPERQQDIFETFTQADATITRRFGGTGLGLAISRRLAHAMGGDIEIRSHPGEGSRFTLVLDLPIASDAIASQHKTASGSARAEAYARDVAGTDDPGNPTIPARPLLQGHTLLVAEDNRTNRMLIGKMLANTGAALRFAETGADALHLYADMRPDAILMDMSMPIMDGLEATQRIRALEAQEGWAACPIIALTANAFDEDRRRCLQAGMNGHLSKPVRKANLLETLLTFLQSGEAPATESAALADLPLPRSTATGS